MQKTANPTLGFDTDAPDYANEMGVTVFVRCARCNRTCCSRAPLVPGDTRGEMVVRTRELEPPSDWRRREAGGDTRGGAYRGRRLNELLCGVCASEDRGARIDV